MFKILLLFTALALPIHTFCQIIGANSRPIAGDVFQFKLDTITVDTSILGMNVRWDFSQLNLPDTIYSQDYLQVTFNGTGNSIIGATYFTDGYYYSSDFSGIIEKGFIIYSGCPFNYNNTLRTMKYPFAYGDTLNDTYYYFNDCPIGEFSGNGSIHVIADGIGTLKLPTGNYQNTLRVKSILYRENTKTIKYEWYNTGKKFPILTYLQKQNAFGNTSIFGKKLMLWYNESFLSVQSLNTSNFIAVYPNPTSKYININNTVKYTQFEIFDISGQLITQVNLQAAPPNIDISAIENGVYLIKLSNKNSEKFQKLIISH